jgi:hypothetical protein
LAAIVFFVAGFLLVVFLAARFPAAGFARFDFVRLGFATLVDFGKAFLLKDRSPTLSRVTQRRQMFLACFVSVQSGFVVVWR